MFGNLVKKVKSAVPKVTKTNKKVKPKVLARKVRAAVPKVIKAPKNKKPIIKKIAAAIPKVTFKTKSKTPKKKEKKPGIIKDLKNRNKRIVEKIKEEWKKTESGLDRGIVTMGARAFGQPPKIDLKTLDFILKSRKVILEEYPILNWQTNMGKGVLKTVKDGIVSKGRAGGSFIYELNIPVISNFAGELWGVREEEAKSGVSSTVGALTKGILVDGLGGTVEGLANVMVDPIEAIGGITTILAYPDETLPVIWEGVKGVWNDKIVNGSAEDRANIAGQAVFEVATWLVGVGEAKAGSSVAKAADKTADIAKVTDKIADVSKVVDKTADIAKATDKIADASKVLDKATDLARYKTGLKTLGKDIVKGLDDQALAAGKKFGNAVDQMRYSMNQLTRNMQPQFAGIGNLDEMGSTADKIEDLFKAMKKSAKKQDAVGSGIHIRGGVEEQVIGKIDEGVEVVGKVSDDVAKGTVNVTRAQQRNLETLDNIVNKHLTDKDFSGTLRDLQGNPVPKPGGGYWNHLQEMQDSYKGLVKIKRGLEGSLNNPNIDATTRKVLQDGLDKANKSIKKIEDLFEPFGGI